MGQVITEIESLILSRRNDEHLRRKGRELTGIRVLTPDEFSSSRVERGLKALFRFQVSEVGLGGIGFRLLVVLLNSF